MRGSMAFAKHGQSQEYEARARLPPPKRKQEPKCELSIAHAFDHLVRHADEGSHAKCTAKKIAVQVHCYYWYVGVSVPWLVIPEHTVGVRVGISTSPQLLISILP